MPKVEVYIDLYNEGGHYQELWGNAVMSQENAKQLEKDLGEFLERRLRELKQ